MCLRSWRLTALDQSICSAGGKTLREQVKLTRSCAIAGVSSPREFFKKSLIAWIMSVWFGALENRWSVHWVESRCAMCDGRIMENSLCSEESVRCSDVVSSSGVINKTESVRSVQVRDL